jgi:D-xylose 1-dehydrogenase (NADP+, D-xylono-1,5-lactone-forming)
MQSNVTASDKFVRWGVLGSANIGVRYVSPAIHASSNGRLLAVASRNPREAAELYSFAPNARIYDDYDAVINNPEIDAIYVPLPNNLHAEWTIKALQAGKHVLCEKPLAATTEEAKEMATTARQHNVLLMEAFMYRFHPQIQWTLEQVEAGLVGQIRLVRASFSFDIRSRPENIRLNPELAGGSLMDVGCYTVNFCRAVYGHSPLMASARVHMPKPTGVELATNALLDFGNGGFALLDCSFELPARQMVEIMGELGTITLPVPFTPGNSDVTIFVTKEGKMTEHNFSRVDQYQLEVEHFADCILLQREPALRMSETLENIATLEAIYQAACYDWPRV